MEIDQNSVVGTRRPRGRDFCSNRHVNNLILHRTTIECILARRKMKQTHARVRMRMRYLVAAERKAHVLRAKAGRLAVPRVERVERTARRAVKDEQRALRVLVELVAHWARWGQGLRRGRGIAMDGESVDVSHKRHFF